MPIAKIGIQTASLRLPLRRALAIAAQLGADGVEIDLRHELPVADLTHTARRELRKLLDDLGLRLAAVAYPTRRGYDDPEQLERRLHGTQQAMKAAADLGARVLVNRVVRQLPLPDEGRPPALLQALTSLAQEGTRVGTRLAALTTTEPPEELAQLIAALPEGTIGVALHPAHLLEAGHSPVEALETLGSYVLHTYASDTVRDFGTKHMHEVDLGRGAADWPALVAALAAYDYHGWMMIERRDAADPLTEIDNAVAYLRSLRD